jgi:hypothetical protein
MTRDFTTDDDATRLNVFCTEEDDAWRVYLGPGNVPEFLSRCFDSDGEAFPVVLDFEDLDRYMRKRDAAFEKRVSNYGDVELTARGRAATELAQWLASASASTFRDEHGDVAQGRMKTS